MQEKIEIIRKCIDKNLEVDIAFISEIRQYNMLEDWVNTCPDENALNECLSLTIPQDIMIGDILQWEDENGNTVDLGGIPFKWKELLHLWKNKDQPIQNQSEECVNFVFSLFQ